MASVLSSPVGHDSTSDPAVADSRALERYPCGLLTSCQPVAARSSGDMHWPATIRDISAQGMGLVLCRRFERGVGLAVEVPQKDGTSGDTLLCQVIHVQPWENGQWLMGVRFVSELGQGEVEAILDLAREAEEELRQSLPEGYEDDGKGGRRLREYVIPMVLFVWADQPPDVKPALVRRLIFRGRWPLRPGSILRVKVPIAGGEQTEEVAFRVRQAEQIEGMWEISCGLHGAAGPEARRYLGFPER